MPGLVQAAGADPQVEQSLSAALEQRLAPLGGEGPRLDLELDAPSTRPVAESGAVQELSVGVHAVLWTEPPRRVAWTQRVEYLLVPSEPLATEAARSAALDALLVSVADEAVERLLRAPQQPEVESRP
ncbi:MAG: hypothetical protein H6740_10510 [Alphaproteobacteria bacterium]|nr:hypothetical protein [Alphaproteobacteria bacterium]